MNSLADRLHEALKHAGISRADLARACGVRPPSVSDWFSGKTKNLSGLNLLNASKALGVRQEWLGSGKGQMIDTNKQGYEIGQIEPWSSSTPLDADDVEVPFYKEVEMAAGMGSPHSVEINGRKLRFAKSTLRAAGVSPENAACATVTGNSMERLIMDGATIGIDRGRTQVKDGKIYAIDHGGMLRVKYLYRTPGGGLRLHSENEVEHPDEMLSADQVAQDIKILGWVFWWSQIATW